MPPAMAATCMSADDAGCGPSDGWSPGGDHMHSDRGHADDAYLVLSLKVGGFRGRGGFVNGQPMEVGRISFTFQLDCSSECEFVFMEGSAKKGVTILQSWTGQQPRQFYSCLVRRNDSFTFSWAFQKVSWEKSYLRPSSSRRYEGDVAKIFNINVTNTVDGGASTCLPCPQGVGGEGCVPCPPGHYIEANTTACTACPPGTVVTEPLPYGSKSCLSCGPGLTAPDGLTCRAECLLSVQGRTYDLSNISRWYSYGGRWYS
ncbi:endosome/lysosome-associated apoptosis and autophagy regulator family member 2 [Hyalella azteca]|uniref:Endosome/lysosome-associated apoptosis and autophagy regulator family member 2 n=1 Tax=Hyalella azteca TaxID=294128 RepID=A0A979FI44_HYAAZ|nr:endosome/lysosome-associated apoptosis and autophagy regulator family member 2 [Hyalella azteca]